MSTLLETLRCASGRASTLTDLNGTGSAGEIANTIAGTKDGSDATYDGAVVSGDGAGTAGAAQLDVDYTLDASATPAAIDSVRVTLRARRTSGASTSTTVRPRIAGAGQGSTTTPSTTATNYTFDFTTDPRDGLPWTAAKINSASWGAEEIVYTTTDVTTGTVLVTDIKVEAFGHIAPPATGLTLSPQAGTISGAVLPMIVAAAVTLSLLPVAPVVTAPKFGDRGRLEVASISQQLVATVPPQLDGSGVVADYRADASAGGTLQVQATAIQDGLDTGAIESVEFWTIAYTMDISNTSGTSNSRMAWTVGADSATAPVTPGIVRNPSGYAGDDPLRPQDVHTTGPITTQPNGQPWSWAAVNALTNVAVRLDFVPMAYAELKGQKVWVVVNGVENRLTVPRRMRYDLGLGCARRTLGTGVAPAALALPGPMRKTLPLGEEE